MPRKTFAAAAHTSTARFMFGLLILVGLDGARAQAPHLEATPYCLLVSSSAQQSIVAPANAAALRGVAKRYPRNPREFGPPPSQTDIPGAVWDVTNEYWYQSADKVELLLYCNTDDRYVYYWRFRSSGGKIRLANHGLLNCN